MTPLEVLKQVRETITEDNWCQHTTYQHSTGKMCVGGHVESCAGGDVKNDNDINKDKNAVRGAFKAMDWAAKAIGDSYWTFTSLNDNTDFDTVIRMLDKAIAYEESIEKAKLNHPASSVA